MNVLRIPVEDLKKGMYVVNMSILGHGDEAGAFAYTGFVDSDDQWRSIRADGYICAYVDSERSNPPLLLQAKLTDTEYLDPQAICPAPQVALGDELEQACDVRQRVFEAAREAASRTLSKTNFSLFQARQILAPLRESVERNANALLCLGVLHNKDDYTFAHCVDVAILSLVLGRKLGVKQEYIESLVLAGFFHDIGKLFIPDTILRTPNRLSAEQFSLVRQHAELGYEYLMTQSGMPRMVLEGALEHQERYDGNGYPRGKAGTDISFIGRLLAVVDVYDALSGLRHYRKALIPSMALSQLYSTKDHDFAPGYVEALVSALGVYPPGSLVQLNTLQQAVVIEAHPVKCLRPKIVLLTDSRGRRIRPKICDLDVMEHLEITHSLERLPFALDIENAIQNAS